MITLVGIFCVKWTEVVHISETKKHENYSNSDFRKVFKYPADVDLKKTEVC